MIIERTLLRIYILRFEACAREGCRLCRSEAAHLRKQLWRLEGAILPTPLDAADDHQSTRSTRRGQES
jgi:hypothetical protein